MKFNAQVLIALFAFLMAGPGGIYMIWRALRTGLILWPSDYGEDWQYDRKKNPKCFASLIVFYSVGSVLVTIAAVWLLIEGLSK